MKKLTRRLVVLGVWLVMGCAVAKTLDISGLTLVSATGTVKLTTGKIVSYTGISKVEADRIFFVAPEGATLPVFKHQLPQDVQDAILLAKRLGVEMRAEVSDICAAGVFLKDPQTKTEKKKDPRTKITHMAGNQEVAWETMPSQYKYWHVPDAWKIFVLGNGPALVAGAGGGKWQGMLYSVGVVNFRNGEKKKKEKPIQYLGYALTPEEAALYMKNRPQQE